MNTKTFLLSTSCTAFVMVSTAAIAQNSVQQTSIQQTSTGECSVEQTSTQTSSNQTSETSISLATAQLRQKNVLRVSAPTGTDLTGRITLNGKLVEEISNNTASVDLSSRLSKGRQTIKVSGTYKPADASIRVEFSGPGTQIAQEVGGSGRVNQTLVINVQ